VHPLCVRALHTHTHTHTPGGLQPPGREAGTPPDFERLLASVLWAMCGVVWWRRGDSAKLAATSAQGVCAAQAALRTARGLPTTDVIRMLSLKQVAEVKEEVV
jgi:hypothetical protein